MPDSKLALRRLLPGGSRIPPGKWQPFQIQETVGRRLTLLQTAFILVVAVPTLVTALFYGLIASDRYVSEASFLVRGESSQSAGGLSALLRTFGMSRADDDTYAVQDYIRSREAVKQLDERMHLREVYSRPGTDWFTRFPAFWRRDTFESMYNYYLWRMTILNNPATGITKVEVSAFRPDDARDLALHLLKLAEELVNRLNDRAQRDSIRLAQQELERAEAKVIAAQAAITAFRNRELIIDPNSNSAKSLEVVGRLIAELAQTKVQLQQTMTSAPSNPAIPALQVRAAALQGQIDNEQQKLTGRDGALASKMSAYERLVLAREFADRELTLSSGAVEMARQQARRQQIYIETVAGPNLPDESTEPRRWRAFFTVLLFSLAIYSMVWFFVVGAREQLHG